MTLILCCATPKYLVQVSDRRLTWFSGPNAGRIADDRSNKAVVFCAHIAFAYTGLAQIGAEKTDHWIGRTLADPALITVSDACRKLELAATASFRGIRIAPEQKHHAFCGVGWVRFGPEQGYQAFLCSISNAQDDAFQWLPRAEDKFTLRYRVLSGSEPLLFLDVGQSLPPSFKTYLVRHLRRAVEHDVSALSIVAKLIEAVRAMSQHFPAVGADVLALTLPVAAAAEGGPWRGIIGGGPADTEQASFLYVPADRTDPFSYGPDYVCDGGWMRGFTAGPATGESKPPPAGVVTLTRWIGSGAEGDTRRAELSDAYRTKAWRSVDAPGWPKDEPCPFYGLLVEFDAEPEVIQAVRSDSRFAVISEPHEDRSLPLDTTVLAGVRRWLVEQGMLERDADTFVRELEGVSCTAVIQSLVDEMRKPKP